MRSALSVSLVAMTLAGCQYANVAGRYNISQEGYGFGEGAEKIELDLRPDKTFDVKVGALTLLEGNYESDGKTVTFSRGQGAMVVSYRVDGGNLRPVHDGKDAPGWMWKRK